MPERDDRLDEVEAHVSREVISSRQSKLGLYTFLGFVLVIFLLAALAFG